jgi:hypothetical protein
MEIKSIPVEIVIALISGLYAFMIMLWSKMDKIWKAIGHIEKDYVEHDVCDKRRHECPCKKDIERIEKVIYEGRKPGKI